ncbi:hypothetical protein Rs2_37404 [Raphanus sativus]|nr:hypothetical protein Rs2_37404 [Raphanus sativus]
MESSQSVQVTNSPGHYQYSTGTSTLLKDDVCKIVKPNNTASVISFVMERRLWAFIVKLVYWVYLFDKKVNHTVQEAERVAQSDKEKRDAIDTKNQADSVVYQTERQLKELGEKIPDQIKEVMAALNQEVMQIGQSLYNQPGAGAGGADPSPRGEGSRFFFKQR